MHRHVDVADIHRHAGVGGCPIEKGGSLRKKRKAIGQKKGVVDMHRHAWVGGCPIEKGRSLRKKRKAIGQRKEEWWICIDA